MQEETLPGIGQPGRALRQSVRRSPAASSASRSIPAQSPAASLSAGVSHEPPTHSTLGSARKSAALARLMPPVGQKRICGSGLPHAPSSQRPAGYTGDRNADVSTMGPAVPPATLAPGLLADGAAREAIRTAACRDRVVESVWDEVRLA